MKIIQSIFAATILLTFAACGQEVAEPIGTIELGGESILTTGISVNENGIYLLSEKRFWGDPQEIQHLSLEGELLERIEITSDAFYFDIFQIDERRFALASTDEVSSYDSAMDTVEPFYCFVPGPLGIGGDGQFDEGPDRMVHAIASQPSKRLFWGTQRSDRANELRAYRFGETESAAHVFELEAELEPSGLVVGSDLALLTEVDGTLHVIDLESGAMTLADLRLGNEGFVDGMDSHEGILYVYESTRNRILKFAIDELL